MSRIIYSDVSLRYWARREIYFLTDLGIVQGIGGGRFHPEGTVTVGQLCAIAVRTANIPPFYGDSWRSDPGDHWAKKYVDYVWDERGLRVHEQTGDVISLPITRQFAFNIAWRMVAINDDRFAEYPYNNELYDLHVRNRVTDIAAVHDYNEEGIYQLVRNGIVTGRSSRILYPAGTLTRAELSRLVALCIGFVPGMGKFATHYDIPVAVRNMQTTSSRQFEIAYDPRIFTADDLCVHATENISTVGVVPGMNVDVTRFDSAAGVIEFTYTGNILPTGFTGIVNTVRFKSGDDNAGIGDIRVRSIN
jgi:hypothetical protein